MHHIIDQQHRASRDSAIDFQRPIHVPGLVAAVGHFLLGRAGERKGVVWGRLGSEWETYGDSEWRFATLRRFLPATVPKGGFVVFNSLELVHPCPAVIYFFSLTKELSAQNVGDFFRAVAKLNRDLGRE